MDRENLALVRASRAFIAKVLLCCLQVSYTKGETCVVETIAGGTTAPRGKGLCGSNEHPCSHLEQCFIERKDVFKDIVIRGNYSFNTTTKISISVSIRGVNTIVTGPAHSFLAEISGSNKKISVNVTNIHFREIGILKIGKHVDAFISNCNILGPTRSVVQLHPEAENVVVQLIKSEFIDSSDYVLEKAYSDRNTSLSIRVHIHSCNFTRSKGLFLQSITPVTVSIVDCVFRSNGTSVVVVASDRNRLSEVKLIGCVFQDASSFNTVSSEYVAVKVIRVSTVSIRNSTFVKSFAMSSIAVNQAHLTVIKGCFFKGISAALNEKVGAIVFSNSAQVLISRCTFLKNSAIKGGSIAAINIKTMKIDDCTFKDNRAGSFAGDVYMENVDEAVFKSNFFYNSSSGARGGSVYAEQVTNVLFQAGNMFHGCFTGLHGECICAIETKRIEVEDNNSFHSCSSNKAGGCIYGWRMHRMVFAWRNHFENCSAITDGGCINSMDVKSVEIREGNTFHNCSALGDGGCIYSYEVTTLNINENNIFHNCLALRDGGCISGYKVTALSISGNNTLHDCSTLRDGGCISSYEVTTLNISENNTFYNCSASHDGGCISTYKVKTFKINENNTFHNCLSNNNGGCIDANDVSHMQISGRNSFARCSAVKYGGCIRTYKMEGIEIGGNNSFDSCSTKNFGGCISANRAKKVLIIGSAFTNTIAGKGGAIGAWILSYVVIDQCYFFYNSVRKNGGAIFLSELENITVFHSYFFRNTALGSGAALAVYSKSNIHILFSIFLANKADEYGGAIYAVNHQMIPRNCSSRINRCRFQNNEATFGGALSTKYQGKANPYQYTIEDTMFVNNSALVLGQAIFNNEKLQLHNVSTKAHERRNVYHIYSFINTIGIKGLNVTLLRHRNKTRVSSISSAVFLSSFKITVQQGINISCPVGFNIFTRNSSYGPVYTRGKQPLPVFTYLTLQCKACNANSYTLARGKLTLDNLTRSSTPLIEHHHCTKCPEGGICDKDVRAADNHWGYFVSQSLLQFQTCPEGYCCNKENTRCLSYNTCAYPRTGILCGKCDDSFKLSFHSSECIPKGDSCNFLWFALYILMFSVAYTGTFIVVTNFSDILGAVKEMIQSRRNNDQRRDSSQDEDYQDDFSIAVRPKTSKSTFSIAGFVQIIVLYLQVALMLRVKYQGADQKSEGSSTKRVYESIDNVFNFRITLYQEVCPSDSLTFPQKEAILFGTKIMTFSELLVSMGLYAIMVRFCRKKGMSRNITTALQTLVASGRLDDDNNRNSDFVAEQQDKINFGHRLKMTYLKLLKLYFTPITKSALMMTHCVGLRGSYHLFVYGDLVCYKNWQIAIMTVILPGIVLFPFSYDLSLRMLERRVLSSTNFVAASACPYYAVIIYMSKRRTMKRDHNDNASISPDEEDFTRRVLQAENLFSQQKKSLNWQTIQFYRTILMNITTIVITNPLHRFLSLVPILCLFCIHDRNRKPYKDARLNRLQTMSSRCLLLVLVCNLVASISFTADVSMVEGVTLIVKICTVVEIMLYAVVPLYLPLWKVLDIVISRRGKKVE